jgi:peroxiredoxin
MQSQDAEETRATPAAESGRAAAERPEGSEPPRDPRSGGEDAPGRHRQAPWRRPAIALLAIVLIGTAIWQLESGAALPFLGRSGKSTREGASSFSRVGAGAFGDGAGRLGAAAGPAPRIGAAAPDFTLLSLDGTAVRLSDLRGKTVVINFWATWCIPCKQEFPEFVALYKQQAERGLVVVGVDQQESPDAVRSFAAEFDATYPLLLDSSGSVSRRYRVPGLPVTLVVDRQGIVRAQHVGQVSRAMLLAQLADAGFAVAGSP